MLPILKHVIETTDTEEEANMITQVPKEKRPKPEILPTRTLRSKNVQEAELMHLTKDNKSSSLINKSDPKAWNFTGKKI